ncbi:hypothetical protein [Polaribacter ponticola]|uniref:Uncharacterized protein n=1 Tax=Polaribacter ponticola TaxID=2978475 RepID=A0ABT5S5R8_9FLAO|nr:hypothetical protein [Polaribacter sp. MSW5]MDD7913446.1 hypothetical protein [Polaribacter sp. MSW5]
MVESEELLIEPLFKFVEEKGSINTLVTVSERALHTKINGEYIEIIHPIKKITKIINKNKLCVDDEFIAEICWIKANNNISENDLINYHKLEGSILYHYKLDLLLGTSRLFLLKSEFEINK